MAAICYHCKIGTSPILGLDPGDPLGICQKCHVMACGGHAVRDRNYPRWICVVCDTTLLSASAARTAGATTILAQFFSSALLRDEGLFPNLNAYIDARPEMRWVLEDVKKVLDEIELHIHQRATDTMWESLTPEGRHMIAAAIVIIRQLRINTWELAEGLRILVKDLSNER